MNTRARLVFACLAVPLSAGAHESHSANFRNLSAGAATSATAPAPAAAPVARPAALTRAAAPVPAGPAPAMPSPSPEASYWLWAATAAGTGAAFILAFALARRRRDESESIAFAAHELKSPLAAIEAYLALMEADGRSGAADARAWLEDVGRMRTTAAHLRRTIGDMLEMTRLEDGRLRLEARAFDLDAVARDCVESYGALAAEYGLSLRWKGAPAQGWGDPDRTRQILDNLVGNALRFAAPGGTVTVTCDANDGVRAAVADDGPGVPARERSRLFVRFARLSEPTRGAAGTGLGLYIGRRLAEASGGTLQYAPGPNGRGSVFTLTLPEAPS